MKNTQVTNLDNIIVQKSKEEVLMEPENGQAAALIESQTPLDLVKKIISLSKKGYEITFDNEKLHPLFLDICVSSQGKLLPEVEKITDFKIKTKELINAGDALAEIINYSDKGFQLTDVPEDQQNLSDEEKEYSEEHACKKVGLEERIGTHSMRKTFGYHHYQQFKDIALLQKIFNHSSQLITLRYIGIDQEQIDYTYNNFVL